MQTRIENIPEELRHDSKYTVYMHVFPNGKRYIGITGQDVRARWRTNGNGYKPQRLVYRAIKKYGWDNIEHIIVSEELTADDAGKLEKELIKRYRTTDVNYGYNQSIGGENSPIGVKRSEETRKKLSVSHIGHAPYNKGGHLGEQQKALLRQANAGKRLSEETRRKISEKNKGRKPTAFAVQRCKERCNKPVICIESGVIYESATVAGRSTGEHRNTITRHCREEVRNPRWAFVKKK